MPSALWFGARVLPLLLQKTGQSGARTATTPRNSDALKNRGEQQDGIMNATGMNPMASTIDGLVVVGANSSVA